MTKAQAFLAAGVAILVVAGGASLTLIEDAPPPEEVAPPPPKPEARPEVVPFVPATGPQAYRAGGGKTDPNDPMIKAATLGRAHPDPDARAELVTLLGHEERNVRLLAVRFLSRWDDAGGDLLVQYSVEPKPAVRQVILMTLAKVNTLNYDDALWERFDLEEKERLQKQIIRTIAGRGGAEIDRPALKRFEAASDVKVKRLLLQSLGEFGRAETVYALLPYALPGSQHEDVKGLVAKTIRQICTATNTAVPMALEPVNTEADGLGDRATLIPSSGG